jgi:hypothetical protein
MIDIAAAAQIHVNAIHDFMGYVLQRCPQACDQEMESRFNAAIQSFECYEDGKDPDPPEAWEVITEASIGRNYTIAHAFLLQSFVNAVRTLSIRKNDADLRHELEALDTRVKQNFENFFAEPFATIADIER